MATQPRSLVLQYFSKLNKSGSKEIRIGLEWLGSTHFETCIQLSGENGKKSIFLNKNKHWPFLLDNKRLMLSYFNVDQFEFVKRHDKKISCDDVSIGFTFTYGSNANGVILKQQDNILVFQYSTLVALFSKEPLIGGYEIILQKQPVGLYINSIVHELTQDILSKRLDVCFDRFRHIINHRYEEIFSLCLVNLRESNPSMDTSSFVLFWNDIVENYYSRLYTEVSKNCRSFM